MKKIAAIIVIALIAVASLQAQGPRAVGGRAGFGPSVTYQHYITDASMITADVDFINFRYFGAAATYDWLNPFGSQVPWSTPRGDWNWYLGAGLSGGFQMRPNERITAAGNYIKTNSGYFGAVGRIGLEYEFWFPLQLACEWRPIIGVQTFTEKTVIKDRTASNFGANYHNSYNSFFSEGLWAGAIAVCVRYIF